MSQRLKTFLQVWCLLTVILFLLGFYFTEDKSSRSYLYHVAVEQPEDQLGQEVTEFHPDTRKILYGDNQQCRLRKKIIFAKTHKTGSTTLQNIVFRFGQEHQLLFVLPKSGTHYFNLRSHFRTSMADLYKLYKNVSFSVFAAHSRWDAMETKSLIPGAFSMTILREPLETFESFYSYMNIDRRLDMDINQFAQSLVTRQESNMSLDVARGRNKALYDLGLDTEEMFEQEDVIRKIQALDQEFDQVLILERLEESLVMMAQSLCWSLDQVRFVQLNSRHKHFVTSLSQQSRDILTDWLWADRLLYNFFLRRHRSLVDNFGVERMGRAVKMLGDLNDDLRAECVSPDSEDSKLERVFRANNKKIQPIVPNQHRAWCRNYFKTEIAFTKSIRVMNRLHVRKNFKISPAKHS